MNESDQHQVTDSRPTAHRQMGTRKFVLMLVLVVALLAIGVGALWMGLALSDKNNALALIALIVAPALTVITSLATALMSLIKGLDGSD